MEITINDKNYNIKYSLRAMLVFEQIKGEAFKVQTMMDQMLLLYSMIIANNQDVNLKFDELLDEIDNNPDILQKFTMVLEDYQKTQELFDDGKEVKKGKKKA